MSTETLAAIRSAIVDHISDECDQAMLLDWVLVTAEIDTKDMVDGTTGHLVISDTECPGYRQRGLLEIGRDFHMRGLHEDD